MSLQRGFAILVLGISLSTIPSVSAAPWVDSCWETCFLQAGTGESSRYKEVYDNLLEIALDITYLKNLYNITRIGWIIDSALSNRFNQAENTFTERLENGNNIFKFEIMLAMALVLIVNGPYNYIVQYDEQAAWTCNEFSCISTACATVGALNKQANVEMLPTSFCPGDIEAGCKLLSNQITSLGSCGAPNQNTMAVAITNNNFYISDGERKSFNHRPSDDCPKFHWGGLNSDSSSSEELFSPCHSYFDTRYVVGTQSPSEDVMKLFPSFHGRYRYIHDEKFSYNALANLLTCMLAPTNCCTTVTAPTVATCSKTQGPFGEVINNYPTHPAFTASNNIFGATLPGAITPL